jgi:hypothetical protein
MARMKGVEPHEAGWYTRFVYWMVKRGMGKITGRNSLIEPMKVVALHPRLMKAHGQMEMGQAAATAVPAPLKALAGIKAASLVGCPF